MAIAMSKTAVACLLVTLIATSAAQRASAPAAATTAFAPTTTTSTVAPAVSPTARLRTGNYAADSLANTPTSYNQIQTIGVYQSVHVAPPAAIQEYLATPAVQSAIPASAYVPQSTQFTQLPVYNLLETLGSRQLHFKIYYDPTGKLYQVNAGLKIVNSSDYNVSSYAGFSESDKWTFPGWKVMNEPNFDFNSTCITLASCLQNVKNWLLTTPSPVPLTIYLEPSTYVFTTDNSTFAAGLKASNISEGPTTLATPLNIKTYQPLNQPWRDLENELLNVFDRNSYFSIVTPDNIMDDGEGEPAETLKDAVFQEDYTLYPALQYLKSRIFFVLTGDYVQNYLEYYPDLKNATMFIAEPYNESGNYTDSTLFVDVIGPLSGVNTSAFNASAANTAAATQADQVSKTVKEGYMVRASADWNTVEARQNFTGRATRLLAAGAHFVQTSFPTTTSLFPSTYTVALPIRGNVQQSARCNPVTSGGTIFDPATLYTSGCPAVNGLTPASAPSASSA